MHVMSFLAGSASRGCKLRESSESIRRPIARIARRFLFVIVTLVFGLAPASGAAPKRMHPGETQTGMASWYGAENGRHTSSGEHFNKNDLTAAHRKLPFGTLVRVTNQLNGKSVDVRINDRGPWVHNRIIDVTDAAATVLDMKKQGTVPVTILVLHLGAPSKKAGG